MGVMSPQSGFNWDVSQDFSNEYHFYSIVLDDLQNGSTLAKLYVDGVSMGQHTYPYSIQSYSEMEIGRNIVEQNGLYNGNISEIQFWNRALSAQEIHYRMVISPEGILINLTLSPTKNFALFKSKTLAEYVILIFLQ